mmetsp:Transcript_145987/g.468115  ORF Transcript_145987/g.468115 Transcript_145987/m.468115 type:complete len:262 (-) Transcript_145987:433-1218(-)
MLRASPTACRDGRTTRSLLPPGDGGCETEGGVTGNLRSTVCTAVAGASSPDLQRSPERPATSPRTSNPRRRSKSRASEASGPEAKPPSPALNFGLHSAMDSARPGVSLRRSCRATSVKQSMARFATSAPQRKSRAMASQGSRWEARNEQKSSRMNESCCSAASPPRHSSARRTPRTGRTAVPSCSAARALNRNNPLAAPLAKQNSRNSGSASARETTQPRISALSRTKVHSCAGCMPPPSQRASVSPSATCRNTSKTFEKK